MARDYKITDTMIDDAACAINNALEERKAGCFLASTDDTDHGCYEFQRDDYASDFSSDAELHCRVVDSLPAFIKTRACPPAVAALLIDKICEVQMLRSKVKDLELELSDVPPLNISLTGEQVHRMAQLFNDVNDMELGGIVMNLTQNERGSIFVDITVRQFEVEP